MNSSNVEIKEVIMPLSAINHTIKTKEPTITYLNEDKDNPVVVLTKEQYDFLIKITSALIDPCVRK